MTFRHSSRLLLFVSIFLFGCGATVPMASPEEDALGKQFKLPAEGANLYIVRGKGMVEGVLFPVVLDGVIIGVAAPGTYFLIPVAAGKHRVSVNSEYQSKSSSIKVEAGRNYFLEVRPEIGFISGGIDLELLDEQEGQNLVQKTKRARVTFGN